MIHPAPIASIRPNPAVMLPEATFFAAAPVLLLLFPAIPLETGLVVDLVEVLDRRVLAVVLGCTVTTVVPASVVSSADVLVVEVEDVDTPVPDEGTELDPPVDPDPVPLVAELLLPEPELALPSPPETMRPVPHGIADPSGCVCSGAAT